MAAAAILGCAAPSPSPSVSVSAPWAASSSAVVGDGSRWAYHPPSPAGLLAAFSLDEKKTLFVGRKGERWLFDAASGRTEAAGDLAEQDLRGVARSPSGTLRFVGVAGAVFEAMSPLGPFERVLSPPAPIARIAAAGSTVAAVTIAGKLLVSRDAGGQFEPAAAPTPLVTDVALSGARMLLLGYPEQVLESADGGATFTDAGVPKVGAFALRTLRSGNVLVEGAVGQSTIRPGSGVVANDRDAAPDVLELPAEVALAPTAAHLEQGRGVLRGDEVIVASRSGPDRSPRFVLLRARLGERFSETIEVDALDGCRSVQLSSSGDHLYAACGEAVRGSAIEHVRFLRWRDLTEPPELLAHLVDAPARSLRFVASPSGSLLVAGACRPGSRLCDATSMLVLPSWSSAPTARGAAPAASAEVSEQSPFVAAQVPALEGRPLAMHASRKGDAVLLVGRRGKGNELSIFISRDASKTFEPRALRWPTTDIGERRITSIDDVRLSDDASGSLSLVVQGEGTAVLFALDDDGRTLTSSVPAMTAARLKLGAAGRRALAVEGARAFETTDGGVSWRSLGEVSALRCDGGDCAPSVACADAGCLVGDVSSRVGWGGAPSSRRVLDADLGRGVASFPKAADPIVCRLEKEQRWRKLPRGSVMPSAHGADRGRAIWSSFHVDLERATAGLVHGVAGGKVDEVTLLPPVNDASRFVIAVAGSQVEGAAIARVAKPRDGGRVELRSVDLGWENLYEGKHSKVTVRDLGALREHTSFGAGKGAELAGFGLLSISAGGVFVVPETREHGPSNGVFVDHRGKAEKVSFPQMRVRGPNDAEVLARIDAVHVDGKAVPIGSVEGREDAGGLPALVLAGQAGSRLSSVSLFPSAVSPFEGGTQLDFSYVDGAPHLVVFGFMRRTGESYSWQFPFRGDGSVLGPRRDGPTQARLTTKPRVCEANDRKTARVVMPAEPGTRRPVIVEGPDGARFASLVTDGAVLYGSQASPCVSVLEAKPVKEGDAPLLDDRELALVVLGRPEGSVFFRGGGEQIEVRAMRCRSDAQASVAPAVERFIEGEKAEHRLRVR